MEIREVVSPTVAVPVLIVLVCAFLVFAFGFKSPAQPPSFDVFEEDGKKRKGKKSKVGHTFTVTRFKINISTAQYCVSGIVCLSMA